LAQAIEILHSIDESIDILSNNKFIHEDIIKPHSAEASRGAVGVGVIEAPRGTLYHKVILDSNGKVDSGEVVVPTGQNQINIENDLKKYFSENLDKDEDTLKLEAEKIIRAYDPCMSCATNFLKIDWIRS